MQDASCRPEDLIAAFNELNTRLDERRTLLWDAYRTATDEMSTGEYDEEESECWSVLHAGLAGLDAEQRILRREFESRLLSMEGSSEVVA